MIKVKDEEVYIDRSIEDFSTTTKKGLLEGEDSPNKSVEKNSLNK